MTGVEPLIAARHLKPTEADMAEARDAFAGTVYPESRTVLSMATVHLESLAEALAAGDAAGAALMVRTMLASRRAYVEHAMPAAAR